MNLPRLPELRHLGELFSQLPDYLRKLTHTIEQADSQNLKRTGDLDHPHSLIVRARQIHPFKTFTAADATPSVLAGRNFVTANTGATTITDFDDGTDGQEIVVEIGDGNTTIDFTGTNLTGNGGSDWSPADGDHMRCVYNGSAWLCEVFDNTA